MFSLPSHHTLALPSQPVWHPYLTHNGQHLDVSLSYPSVLWPWSGYLAVSLSVAKDGRSFSGTAEGHISLTVASSTVSKVANVVIENAFPCLYMCDAVARVFSLSLFSLSPDY